MSTTLSAKLPPSERDFELYEFVAIAEHSTREAAARFGMSQTRVRQVLEKVLDFLAAAVPAERERYTEQQRVHVGEQAAAMRLAHLYGEAMRAWRASQGETWSVRSGLYGDVKITRPSFGEVKFLHSAARLAVLAADRPVVALGLALAEQERESGVGNRESGGELPTRSVSEGAPRVDAAALLDKPAAAPQGNIAPPVGDCSDFAVSRGPAGEVAPAREDATDFVARLCDKLSGRKSPQENGPSAPAQLPFGRDADRDRPLTRKERKARRKRLARALAG
jgi:hypothetical protein